MVRWYLIRTKPGGEATAQENLRRQGFEIYLPRVQQTVRRLGRWRESIAPLFPRYLFLRLAEGEQALAPVRSSVGVSDIVRFGSCYAIVPDHIVRSLQGRADPVTGLHRTRRSGPWAPESGYVSAPARSKDWMEYSSATTAPTAYWCC